MRSSFLCSVISGGGKIKWMNNAADSKCQYNPTPIEHILNILTHGIFISIRTPTNRGGTALIALSDLIALVSPSHLFDPLFIKTWIILNLLILPSVYGGITLVQKSQNSQQIFVAVIYGVSLVFIFTTSTLFHLTSYCSCNKKVNNLFHRGDRAMIYIFIAASYFPWLMLSPAISTNELTLHFWWLVWLFALLGVVYQQVFHEKYKRLETLFYVLAGVLPALPIIKAVKVAGLEELKLGGLLYLFGIIFFKSDGKIPCAHAIWHLFVAFAAAVHFFAVYRYLYLLSES